MVADDYENRIKAYRFVAYSTVSFSVIALVSVCFTLPMLHSYVQNVNHAMDRELNMCQVSFFFYFYKTSKNSIILSVFF